MTPEDMKPVEYVVRPQDLPPVWPWWRRVLAKLWPEGRNRPSVFFGRDYGNEVFMFSVTLSKHPQISCYAFTKGITIALDHGKNCDCDDCIPF